MNTDRRAGFGVLLVVLGLAIGCGDGTVPAKGRVTVEGQPASKGQLLFSPVGEGGAQATALVAEDGAFALRSATGSKGAMPGEYSVIYKQPLEGKMAQEVARQIGNEMSVDEVAVTYRSPGGVTIQIPESGDDDLAVAISRAEGWMRIFSE